MKRSVGRPKTRRNTAKKVGFKLMPKSIYLIDKLSKEHKVTKSFVVEMAISMLDMRSDLLNSDCFVKRSKP
jgi:hypothetical protein